MIQVTCTFKERVPADFKQYIVMRSGIGASRYTEDGLVVSFQAESSSLLREMLDVTIYDLTLPRADLASISIIFQIETPTSE